MSHNVHWHFSMLAMHFPLVPEFLTSAQVSMALL